MPGDRIRSHSPPRGPIGACPHATPEEAARNRGRYVLSNQQAFGHHSVYDLAYKVAADPHWATARSTQAGALALPDRRATRTSASSPYNLSVYDLALEHDQTLEEFARRYSGHDVAIPTGRTALAALAADLAATSREARADYDELQLVGNLAAALEIGDAAELLGELTCPGCLCWASLVGTRTPARGHALACRVPRCSTEPGIPRVWTLRQVARHHVRGGLAAA